MNLLLSTMLLPSLCENTPITHNFKETHRLLVPFLLPKQPWGPLWRWPGTRNSVTKIVGSWGRERQWLPALLNSSGGLRPRLGDCEGLCHGVATKWWFLKVWAATLIDEPHYWVLYYLFLFLDCLKMKHIHVVDLEDGWVTLLLFDQQQNN